MKNIKSISILIIDFILVESLVMNVSYAMIIQLPCFSRTSSYCAR